MEVPHGAVQLQGRRVRRPEGADPAGHRGGAAPAPGADPAGGVGDRQPAPAGDAAQPPAGRHREAAGQRRARRSTLADQAAPSGDAAKATEYTNAAEAFAAQLVTAEQSVEDLKTLHDQALQAAGQAKKAVEQNAMVLQQKIAERSKLLSQLEQAKMQEQVSRLAAVDERDRRARATRPASTRSGTRSSAATRTRMGSAELAQNSVQGRMMEIQQASVQMAGHSRLEQIRASMRGDALPSGDAATPADARGQPAGSDAGKPALAIVVEGRWPHGSGSSDGSAGGVAHAGSARRRHRGRILRRRGAATRCRRQSAGQAAAQAAVGAAGGACSSPSPRDSGSW